MKYHIIISPLLVLSPTAVKKAKLNVRFLALIVCESKSLDS